MPWVYNLLNLFLLSNFSPNILFPPSSNFSYILLPFYHLSFIFSPPPCPSPSPSPQPLSNARIADMLHHAWLNCDSWVDSRTASVIAGKVMLPLGSKRTDRKNKKQREHAKRFRSFPCCKDNPKEPICPWVNSFQKPRSLDIGFPFASHLLCDLLLHLHRASMVMRPWRRAQREEAATIFQACQPYAWKAF